MTALGHADVRIDDAHAPCPFCGCGMAPAALHAPRRRTAPRRRLRYTGPAITYEELPTEWRPYMRSTLKRDDGALAATRALNAAIAAKQADGYALVARPTKSGQRVAPEWVKAEETAA